MCMCEHSSVHVMSFPFPFENLSLFFLECICCSKNNGLPKMSMESVNMLDYFAKWNLKI